MMSEFDVVTGAFGYTGKYIARRLLSSGQQVKTLTGHPLRPNPFGDQISVAPFNFDNPRELVRDLSGAATLYNTYWVRFNRGQVSFDRAVANSAVLLSAAAEAGVQRIVHISIANPSKDSPLPYYRGKALVEEAVLESGLSYAILRPTFIFGVEDILLNNIAWFLRRFPLFLVPGSGEYRVQPIFAEDVAELAVTAGGHRENLIMDTAGPEVFTFNQLLRLVAGSVGSKTRILHVPPGLALFFSKLAGLLTGDVVLTQDEVRGLMADLLISAEPAKGTTSLSQWIAQNSAELGSRYTSELKQHYR